MISLGKIKINKEKINFENFSGVVHSIFKKTSPELALYFCITLVFYMNGVHLEPVYGGFITIIITAAFRWAKVKIDALAAERDALEKELHDIKYEKDFIKNNRTPTQHVQNAVKEIESNIPKISPGDMPID